jgi:uncharacterized damage-inducible protein DinB
MSMTADEFAAAVGAEAALELDSAHERIQHCVAQLSDEQLWWRPTPDMNSIGNLILHLCGNVRQWIIAGLGDQPDVRNRPLEFSERGPIAKSDLMQRLDATIRDAKQVIQQQSAAKWLAVRRIQGSEVSGLKALFNSLPHFRGHTQEIIHMTRLLLGDRYQFAWRPVTAEEGA